MLCFSKFLITLSNQFIFTLSLRSNANGSSSKSGRMNETHSHYSAINETTLFGRKPATIGPFNVTPNMFPSLLRSCSELNPLGSHPENAKTQQATQRLKVLRETFSWKLDCQLNGSGKVRHISTLECVDCLDGALSAWEMVEIRCRAFIDAAFAKSTRLFRPKDVACTMFANAPDKIDTIYVISRIDATKNVRRNSIN